MSSIETTNGLDDDMAAAGSTPPTAKTLISQAGESLKQEAQTFASAAQEKAKGEVEKHTQTATKTLGDFATAIRRAGDDLAEHDQSLAGRVVRQAADSLEGISRNLADKQPDDLLAAVRDFGRRNPLAFIGGSILLGVAVGRFMRASERSPTQFADGSGQPWPVSDAQDYDNETLYGGTGAAAASDLDAPLADDLGSLEPSIEGDRGPDVTDTTGAGTTSRRFDAGS